MKRGKVDPFEQNWSSLAKAWAAIDSGDLGDAADHLSELQQRIVATRDSQSHCWLWPEIQELRSHLERIVENQYASRVKVRH